MAVNWWRGKSKLIIEITEYALKLQWVKEQTSWKATRYSVENCEWLTIDKSRVLTEVLREFLEQKTIPHKHYPIEAILLLPFNKGFLREFTVPPLNQSRLSRSVKYLLEEEVLLPTTDRLFDYVKISDRRILLGAIRRSLILNLLEQFEHAGIRVVRVDFAVSRILERLALSPDENIIYLEQNERILYFGVYRGNTPEIFRSLQLDGEPFDEFLDDRSIAQVYRQLRIYQSEQRLRFQRIVVSGELAQHLAQQFVNEGIAEQWSALDTEVITLARGLNLLRQLQSEKKLVFYKKLAFVTTFAGLALGACLSWNAYTKVHELRYNVAELENSLTELEQEVLATHKQWAAWENIEQNSPKLSRELVALQNLVPNGITLEEIELTTSSVFFQGLANNGGEIQSLMLALKQANWQEVSLLQFSQDQTGIIQFILTSTR